MKKLPSIIICSALIAALAAGCSSSPAPARTFAPTPAAPQNVTIRTVSMFGGTDPSASAYQQLIKDFQSKYPDITVTDESATADETWKARVATDFTSDNDPDVMFYFTGADAKQLIDNKKVVDLDTIRSVYPGYAKDITDAAMSSMKEADGKYYAVPVRGFWEGLFCNRDLFDKYNLPLPTTWNNLLAAIMVFKDNGIVPIAASFSDVPHYWIENLILSVGGIDDHHANPKDSYPASWETALGYFKTLYDMGAFPRDVNSTTNDVIGNLFIEKRAAMELSGSWLLGGVKDQENTTVVPFPVAPDGRKDPNDIIAGFSSGFYISAKAWGDPARRDAAAKFVMFMTSRDAIGKLAKDSGAPAADVTPAAGLTNLQKDGLAITGKAHAADMPIDSRMSKEAWTYLISMIGQIATGKAAPGDVLKQAVSLN